MMNCSAKFITSSDQIKICKNSHHIITFQFNSMTFTILDTVFACMQIPSVGTLKEHLRGFLEVSD